MGRKIVVGDIHGCSKTLKRLINKKIRPDKDDELILLGDYINKGPDSKGVLDFLMELKGSVRKLIALKGNHEQNLLDGLKFPWEEIAFKNRGGLATLQSFGVHDIHHIPEKYISFIAVMPYYLETKKFLFVHAGFNFDLEDPFRDDYSMLNIRQMEVQPEKAGFKIIIHGHVPLPWKIIKSKINNKKSDVEYNLDAGCVYPEYEDYGRLVALDLDNWEVFGQKNIE
jgi:serine/threonine protein phosphatase 1